MAWNQVAVICRSGFECGVVKNENGELSIVVREPGTEWPHGINPKPGSANMIQPGFTSYLVANCED